MEIKFSTEKLNRLFPFHIIISNDFKILSSGKSFNKIISNPEQFNFYDLFDIERPFSEKIVLFSDLKEGDKLYYILRLKSNSDLFKGQFEFLSDSHGIFILSPWYNSIEDLKKHNLLVSDFASFDQTFDLLHVIKNIEINTEELKQLTNQLKRKNIQLGLQEEKFRNIIENMNLGILEVDNHDIIQYSNTTFTQLSGYSQDELVGQIAFKLLTRSEEKEVITDVLDDRNTGKSGNFEVKIYTKTGDERIWFISGAPLYNDKGEIIGSIGAHLDITERKNLEKALEYARDKAQDAAKAKELFLANMSHEIRTPLNVVLGMIRLIEREKLNDRLKEYIRQSQYAASHLLSIINDILDISKIEFGEMKINTHPFNIYSLANSLESIFKPNAEEKGLEFHFSMSDEIAEILDGDDIRVRQVLINLLGNSIKFTEKGFVSLDVMLIDDFEDSQKIRFVIKDSGIGMSEDFINHIFDKFSQEANKANRKYAGTGLGMTICRDLLKLMGSKLSIKSTKDIGTQICFELEFQKVVKMDVIQEIKFIEPILLDDCKILLVEDNKINRLIAGKSIEILGCSFEEATNGLEAIELLKKSKFDLILMDIQMPEMDGVEATKIIRKQMNIQTPILALTANVFKQDIDSYIEAGMNDFIIKPIEEDDFFQKIRKYLAK